MVINFPTVLEDLGVNADLIMVATFNYPYMVITRCVCVEKKSSNCSFLVGIYGYPCHQRIGILFPKVLPPNIFTLWVKISIYKFGDGGEHIETDNVLQPSKSLQER